MHWWLVITLIIMAAVAYGYWGHKNESRHLAKSFALLAAERRGEVKPGNWLVFPQLRFEMKNRQYLVNAMATSGVEGSGPFTFVDLELPFDTGQKIRVKRRTGVAKRPIEAVAHDGPPTTGHKDFDEAFRIEGSNQVFASGLLELPVRQKLLGSRMPGLEVRVAGQRISVHIEGIAKSKADLAELIDVATLLADHCPAISTN